MLRRTEPRTETAKTPPPLIKLDNIVHRAVQLATNPLNATILYP